ncbi:unnamed protein product, partial [Adineta steineri]
SASTGPWAPP